MGCFCGKGYSIDDNRDSFRERLSSKETSDLSVSQVNYSLRKEQNLKGQNNISYVGSDKLLQRNEGKSGYNHHLVIGTIPMRSIEGEQVAAGWPSWLASVAGEAIKGWIPRRADSFQKMDKIGQGTYSSVYRARDLDTGKIVALKKVRFDNLDPESVRFMAREICILRRIDHPNVIKLEGLVTSRMSCSLYLVFEYMEHDLSGLASFPGSKFTEPQVKCYVQQLLRGLDHCHSRGVLHRDIKGSNLLIDDNGFLKIADFGLASIFKPHQSRPLTSRVVTLWYRPPELLLGATHYGIGVDLWSTGCILAELYAGKPIMPGRTEVEQLHKIFKLCGSPSEDYWRKSKLPHATIFKPQQPYTRCFVETFKDFPPVALGLMETLLSVDPVDRGTAASALKSEFFATEPLACDPSTLPKYPPSKEFDAKVRVEEARRLKAAVDNGKKCDLERKLRGECMAIPAPDANPELVLSIQKRQGYLSTKSRSEKFNPHQQEVASGFPREPPRQSQASEGKRQDQQGIHKRASHSGPLVHQTAWAKKNQDEAPKVLSGTKISALSGLVAAKRSDEHIQKYDSSNSEALNLTRQFQRFFGDVPDGTIKQEENHGFGLHGTHQKGSGMNTRKDQDLGYGLKGKKIHYSGPLLVPSENSDQILKIHDREIQEVVRRARLDRAKIKKFQVQPGNTTAQIFASSRGAAV
ncbi:hypothetical protein MKW98_023771 [Papaver atlanticum]|uniref:Protein kinase domain-containing protein n=1 Tax=Papaver atlanticum TaxID=357466 RepID=A0AAD4T0M6_9MAGN|nr:hypothetical protein MKW98_023771 [Papaver atlanticum]